MTRGPAGGNDEVIELKNKSSAPVAIGGWQLWGTNASGSSQTARATITGGHGTGRRRVLPAHEQPGRPDRRQPDLLDRHLRRRRPAAALERRRDVAGRRRRQRGADRHRDPVPRGRRPERRARVPDRQRRERLHRARTAARRTPTTTTPTSSARDDGTPTPSCPKDANGFTKITDIQTLGARQPALQRPDRHQDPRHRHRHRRPLRLELRQHLPLRRGPLGPAGHA